MLYKCHAVISIYEVLPEIRMPSITKIVLSSIHGQVFLHEPVKKDVPSSNCSWWLLILKLLDIIPNLFLIGNFTTVTSLQKYVVGLGHGREIPENTNYLSNWTHVHKSCFYLCWSWRWWYPSWWGIMHHEIPTWCDKSDWHPVSLRYTAILLLSWPPLSACIQSSGTLQWMLLSSCQWIADLKRVRGEYGRRKGLVHDDWIALHIFSPRRAIFYILLGGIPLSGMLLL